MSPPPKPCMKARMTFSSLTTRKTWRKQRITRTTNSSTVTPSSPQPRLAISPPTFDVTLPQSRPVTTRSTALPTGTRRGAPSLGSPKDQPHLDHCQGVPQPYPSQDELCIASQAHPLPSYAQNWSVKHAALCHPTFLHIRHLRAPPLYIRPGRP